MARSDFNLVPIRHFFTADSNTVVKTFPVEGNQVPIDDGYLLLQIRAVDQNSHRIRVNGSVIDNSLPPAPKGSKTWILWMEEIPPGVLKSGENTIEIERRGNDDFEVGNVVVNWREPG